jgi:hypothetical protein
MLMSAFALAACGGKSPPPKESGPPPLDLVSSHDLLACVPGAGLKWVVRARLREIAQAPGLVAPLAQVFPEERLAAFAAAHGGVDLRQAHELIVAEYTDASLYAVRALLDPGKLEATLAKRGEIEGRGQDLASPPVVRVFGNVGALRVQLATFGRDAVALEAGKLGPLRAFEAFAMKKLHRAKPAVEAEPLVRVLPLLGDAHVVALAPGPFDETWESGLGGLLKGSTAAGLGARAEGTDIALKLVLAGAWGTDAGAAGGRLSAATNVIAQSAFGRLLGLDAPTRPFRVEAGPEALVLTASFSAEKVSLGLHRALDAQISDIMK